MSCNQSTEDNGNVLIHSWSIGGRRNYSLTDLLVNKKVTSFLGDSLSVSADELGRQPEWLHDRGM